MSARSLVPETFADWRCCIEEDCGITLTPAFVAGRLRALADDSDPHTRRFVAQWGDAHRRRVLGWLETTQEVGSSS